MGQLEAPKREAKKRGTFALISGVATVGVLASGWTMTGLVIGIPVTLYLSWRWISHRARWGMRF